MFVLVNINDRIILKPEELVNIPFEEILLVRARNKYIGKVLNNKGIVVTLKSLKIITNAIVELEGVLNVHFSCALIIFSPESGDLLYGCIVSSNMNGIIVDCDICKVFVPNYLLQENSFFSKYENSWFWEISNDTISSKLYYDIGEKVCVKVAEVNYKNNTLQEKTISTGLNTISNQESQIVNIIKQSNLMNKEISNINQEILMKQEQKYQLSDVFEVIGSFNQSGLGLQIWWEKSKTNSTLIVN